MPLNYAARRPHALLDLLPTARAVVLTDQQAAPLSAALATAITRYVAAHAGAPLVFCYWAAAKTPVAASWVVGAGQVVAIGLDAFGFSHGTVVHWPGQRTLVRRALDRLRGGPR